MRHPSNVYLSLFFLKIHIGKKYTTYLLVINECTYSNKWTWKEKFYTKMSSLKRSLRSFMKFSKLAALSKQVKEIGQPFLVLPLFQLWLLSPPHAKMPDSESNLKLQKNKIKLWPKICFSSRCSIFWRVNKRAQSRFEIKFSLSWILAKYLIWLEFYLDYLEMYEKGILNLLFSNFICFLLFWKLSLVS